MADWTLPEALIACHIYDIRGRDREKAKQLTNCALGMLDRSRGSLNKKLQTYSMWTQTAERA